MKVGRVILILIVVILFAIYFWPGLYRYEKVKVPQFSDSVSVRVNRLSGDVEIFSAGTGWFSPPKRPTDPEEARLYDSVWAATTDSLFQEALAQWMANWPPHSEKDHKEFVAIAVRSLWTSKLLRENPKMDTSTAIDSAAKLVSKSIEAQR